MNSCTRSGLQPSPNPSDWAAEVLIYDEIGAYGRLKAKGVFWAGWGAGRIPQPLALRSTARAVQSSTRGRSIMR